ncbi:MAG: Smr/MutS family protein [Gemmatimonadota bacterium]|nr:Smr/MutS family protein [Gemmatimonadota bacterium]
MSRRHKRRLKEVFTPPTEATGIASLLSETPVATLDLHGYTGAQARQRVRDFLTTRSRISSGSVVHIITGKGTRSDGEAVLLGLVRGMLADEVSEHVAEYAGLLGGGGWVVRLG